MKTIGLVLALAGNTASTPAPHPSFATEVADAPEDNASPPESTSFAAEAPPAPNTASAHIAATDATTGLLHANRTIRLSALPTLDTRDQPGD